jgi:tetratricopeptide (TPR) repeat protein
MKKTIILVIAIASLLSSCNNNAKHMTGNILNDIDTYIDVRPDSALTILQAIDTSSIATKKIEAKYALLLSQALDKNYIDLQSDSIIAPAVRYYDNHGSAEEKMKTLYYRGRIAMNAEKYEDAISYFTKAARYADKVCDKVAVGRVYAAQANIYNIYFDIEKTIKSAELAAEYYLAGRDTIKYLNAIRMVTSQYLYQDSIKVAENLEITRSYWNNLNSQLKSYYYSNLLINSNTASRERIEEMLETYFDEIRDSSKIRWFPVAEAYYTIGNLDKAMESLEIHKLYNRDSTSALYCHTYALVNDMAGNISEALDGYKGYFKATDRLHGFAYTSNVRFIEERYRNEIELYEARHQKERTALISIIGLLCTIIIIFLTLRKLNIRTIEKKTDGDRNAEIRAAICRGRGRKGSPFSDVGKRIHLIQHEKYYFQKVGNPQHSRRIASFLQEFRYKEGQGETG